MSWWPRSLCVALVALLLAGVASTALISAQWQRPAQVHPLTRHHLDTRLLTAWRLVTAEPERAERLLAALNLPESRFAVLAERPAALADTSQDSMDAQETALAAQMRARLALPPAADVRVRLHQNPADGTGGEPRWQLDTAVPLPDGRWLYGQHQPSMMHPHWDRVLRFSLPMIALSALLVALLFSYRIVRPLKTLAQAVARISRGEPPQTLALHGPRSVREITAAFNTMQQRLHRFVRGRTQMLAAISHDLRTPLASLRIRAELIDDPALRRDIIASLDEMAAIADETLDFAREDAVREPPQAVNLSALVSAVVKEQRHLGRPLEWTPPAADIDYRCRPVHLKRALNILIDNASRYGNVRVRLLPAACAGGDVRIEVLDDGPGIADDQLERVFEPFVRLDDARRPDSARTLEHAGAGLGLAIARSCIRSHGGEVTLNNRQGGGLAAVITLPG